MNFCVFWLLSFPPCHQLALRLVYDFLLDLSAFPSPICPHHCLSCLVVVIATPVAIVPTVAHVAALIVTLIDSLAATLATSLMVTVGLAVTPPVIPIVIDITKALDDTVPPAIIRTPLAIILTTGPTATIVRISLLVIGLGVDIALIPTNITLVVVPIIATTLRIDRLHLLFLLHLH